MRVAAVILLLAGCTSPQVRVGSKAFTESVILGEAVAALLRSEGTRAEHRAELGGTQIVFGALERGEIDVYPEYTGTIRQELLGGAALDDAAMRQALAARGVAMSASLGFDNSYALGMREDVAERLGVRTLSDLRRLPELRIGLSNEFMDRADGWPGLRAAYRLPQTDVRGLEHELAYRGLVSGTIDVTDLYTTDAAIRRYGLRVLDDDRRHFPKYEAVLLYRQDLDARVVETLLRLQARLSNRAMTDLNAKVAIDHVPEAQAAADLLQAALGVAVTVEVDTVASRVLARTGEHLGLVVVSLVVAILLGVPLGILCARRPTAGAAILASVGVIQTIPSLALLVFMIPALGLGWVPAVVALLLYSLLPIVRNTCTGLETIPPPLKESAEALGLPPGARLRLVELPLAARSILAGIKTSAVINVGTATLGAVIGAGGYGQPILTGIRLDRISLILEGAVPAAVLALVVQGAFGLLERAMVPRGLKR